MVLHGIQFAKPEIAAFCQANNIQRLALFGSILREDFLPTSDIDVLVEFKPGTRVGLRFFELQDKLSRLFGRTVDLHTPAFLSKKFRDEVLSLAAVQYEAN